MESAAPSPFVEKAARTIITAVRRKFEKNPTAVAVFGEYNCQAKEICQTIASILNDEDYTVLIIEQDDYFRLTPAANLTKRIEDPSWCGLNEVRLDLLDQHIHKLVKGKGPIEKPVIITGEERFETEQIPVFHYDLIVTYGCYTGFLEHTDFKVLVEPETPSTLPGNNPIFQHIYETEKRLVEEQRSRANLVIGAKK